MAKVRRCRNDKVDVPCGDLLAHDGSRMREWKKTFQQQQLPPFLTEGSAEKEEIALHNVLKINNKRDEKQKKLLVDATFVERVRLVL